MGDNSLQYVSLNIFLQYSAITPIDRRLTQKSQDKYFSSIGSLDISIYYSYIPAIAAWTISIYYSYIPAIAACSRRSERRRVGPVLAGVAGPGAAAAGSRDV